jgi:hypothetical protein
MKQNPQSSKYREMKLKKKIKKMIKKNSNQKKDNQIQYKN